uniref:Suppressor of tumorigenicity 7 protein-like n=1 Tax=Propithecus coquereli TaxID=379532 RepID=A0A2K6GLQ4_PROCO
MAEHGGFGEAATSVSLSAPAPGMSPPLGWKERLRAGLAGAGASLWFVAGLGLLYALRVPLRLCENLAAVTVFLNSLTPKFYVALSGTSSLISGLIFIFEWWYFHKHGTSFIEQVSVSHLRPLMGRTESSISEPGSSSSNGESETSRQNLYTWVTGKEPLTYYDMNLSAQDHQTFFTCDTDFLRPSDIVMQKAWRERNPPARIKAAYQALELNNEDTNVLVYIKRRLAMCARKLGRIREAVKIMRDSMMKEFPPLAYADLQAVLTKYDSESYFKWALLDQDTTSVYLLEMKSLILPPEHILKRGDSEAIAYAFFHLQHWKRIEGALNLLQCTWEGTFRMIPYPLEKGHLFYPYPSCTETADRELLPTFHHVSVYPKKELPFFIHFTAGLCSSTAMIALLTHQFPEIMGIFAKAVLGLWHPQPWASSGFEESTQDLKSEDLGLSSG